MRARRLDRSLSSFHVQCEYSGPSVEKSVVDGRQGEGDVCSWSIHVGNRKSCALSHAALERNSHVNTGAWQQEQAQEQPTPDVIRAGNGTRLGTVHLHLHISTPQDTQTVSRCSTASSDTPRETTHSYTATPRPRPPPPCPSKITQLSNVHILYHSHSQHPSH